MEWIDVNKELPPPGEFDWSSKDVIVSDGILIGYGCMHYETKEWTYCLPGFIEQDGHAITHWMPFMDLPKKDDQ